MTKAVDFFRLFLTLELMQDIVKHTNVYAWSVIEDKQSYADKWGAWKETSVEEIEKLVAMVSYFGLVHVKTTGAQKHYIMDSGQEHFCPGYVSNHLCQPYMLWTPLQNMSKINFVKLPAFWKTSKASANHCTSLSSCC